MIAYKVLMCVPSLIAHGATAQAANMVNVVKASIDISQEYKDEVCVLPQHFITLIYDLYTESMCLAAEAAMSGYDKDFSIIEAEKSFVEKADKAISVLSNTAKILTVLREDMSKTYDSVLAETNPPKQEPTVLEESLNIKPEEKPEHLESDSAIATAAAGSTIDQMIAYVKLLKPEDRLALIYSLGLTKYVDMGSITTASIETEEIAQDDAGLNFGIYSLDEIKEKIKNAMLSHEFTTDGLEFETLYTVVENISEKTIETISDEVREKLGITVPEIEPKHITNMEELLESLDTKGEDLTAALNTSGFVLFTIKGDDVVMLIAFTKDDANKQLQSSEAVVTLTRGYLSELRSELIEIKKSFESFSNSLEDADVDTEGEEQSPLVKRARMILGEINGLYAGLNADSILIEIKEDVEA